MTVPVFVALLGASVTALLTWGIRTLPEERWQMLASLPRGRDTDGSWRGCNLTWYGFFQALAHACAVALLLLLTRAAGAPVSTVLAVGTVLLLVSGLASRVVAGIVERRASTFTVGGASFVVLLAAPPLLLLADAAQRALGHGPFPALPFLAAASVAYALGEGLGRLACISFGCCYGRPVRAGKRIAVVFRGPLKKAAYDGNLEGKALFPVQAVTAVICSLTAITGAWLFLEGMFVAAFLLAHLVTQGWRAYSETLRADWRGAGRFSAYQKMAVLSCAIGIVLVRVLPPSSALPPDLSRGLAIFASPATMLFVQAVFAITLLRMGRSTVTASTLTFHLSATARGDGGERSPARTVRS